MPLVPNPPLAPKITRIYVPANKAALERLLYPQVVQREQYTHADYAYVHQELKRKGVTLQLLWEEYHATHGERAYRYSQ